jgi:CheY-like chemotaxis protein
MKRIFISTQTGSDWQRLLAKPQLHWKRGRSAMTAAASWEYARSALPPEIATLLNSSLDDDLSQLKLLAAIPEWEVSLATSGEEALTLLQGHKDKYRALVTDINLDGKMDGWEVAQHAREIEPEFPVVYMSGAAAADWTSKGVPNSIMLAKPFAPAQLLTAVSNLLNSGTPT